MLPSGITTEYTAGGGGGSGYLNPSKLDSGVQESGVREGNGKASITLVPISD